MVFGSENWELIIDVVSIISPSKISKYIMPEHITFNDRMVIMRRDFWHKTTKVISLSFGVNRIYEQRSGLI